MTRAWYPTGLIPWFSKTEGNTYATLLHHPFLFKGKPTRCSRGSIFPCSLPTDLHTQAAMSFLDDACQTPPFPQIPIPIPIPHSRALQILYQASFRFSPSLCLKLRTSFSGDKGVDKGLAITTKQKKEKVNGKREGGGKRG